MKPWELVHWARADPGAAAAEIIRLRAALEPFAEAAKSGVVKDALSFGEPPADLYLTRGFGSITISARAFKTARAALAATPPPAR